MGVRKEFKAIYSKPNQTDTIREMMIASADYSNSLPKMDLISEFLIPKSIDTAPRRKRRLDLSPEEKMLRKKLKNREAAQTSRDKKKAYVTNLEEMVDQLRQENDKLNQKMKLLSDENEVLKQRNHLLEEKVWQATVPSTTGSAVPLNPLPKGLIVPLAVLSNHLSQVILMMISFSTWMTSAGLTIYPTLQILMNLTNLQTPSSKKHWSLRKNQKRMKWWGPEQKMWSPLPPLLTI